MQQEIRVQRSRHKKPGIPAGAVYTGRPSQWGNPAKIGEWYKLPRESVTLGTGSIYVADNRIAVAAFYEHCIDMAEKDQEAFRAWLLPLAGKNLCCWCSTEQVCHADILLYLAKQYPANIGKRRSPLADTFRNNPLVFNGLRYNLVFGKGGRGV